MKRTAPFAKWVLLLGMVAALALTGCGGGGGDGGPSAEDQARIDDAEAGERAEEEAARLAAEQAEQEAARLAAEEAARRAAEEAEAARRAAEEEAARLAAEQLLTDAATKAAAIQSAAAAAAAAKVQSDEATSAVAEVRGSTADTSSLNSAIAAADRAMRAYLAAMAASDTAAMDSTSAADAQAAADTAQAELVKAQAANADAVMYVGMVKTAISNAATEMTALAAARTAAQTAADAARTAAVDAQAAADKVAELVGANTQQAMDAQAAADAADTAADMAESANASAQSAATSGDAQSHQMTAETQQGVAETQLEAAREFQREAQVAHDLLQMETERNLAAELADERGKATDAMDAAKTAADDASTAADDADAARMNLATMQTGEMSSTYAKAARDYADKAMAAYEDAKAASMAADDAETVAAAVAARLEAEDAQGMAENYRTEAATKKDGALAAVMKELKILGTVKSVGGATVDATATDRSVTVDGQTTTTGLLDEKPMTLVPEVMGVQADATADPPVAHVQAVASKEFAIGKTLDSSDDTARLMLITSYGAREAVKVYDDTTLVTETTKEGVITISGVDYDLSPEGMYYPAGADGFLDHEDQVAPDAEPTQVYSYLDAANDKKYVILTRVDSVIGGATTYHYAEVVTTVGTGADAFEPTAGFPVALDYSHIHFGVWAGLGAARADGTQDVVDLGIGFVQSIGDGVTGADMPNNGSAAYTGDWAAAVQAADAGGSGDITLEHGGAMLEADFGTETITATLTGLATLEGGIAGNTFSGTGATVSAEDVDLTAGADFTGSFRGAFYGPGAAEAGGIFDFESEDMEAGAFRGAFGAARKPAD